MDDVAIYKIATIHKLDWAKHVLHLHIPTTPSLSLAVTTVKHKRNFAQIREFGGIEGKWKWVEEGMGTEDSSAQYSAYDSVAWDRKVWHVLQTMRKLSMILC